MRSIDRLPAPQPAVGQGASGRSVVISIGRSVFAQPGSLLLLKAMAGGAPVTVLTREPGHDVRRRFFEADIDLVDLHAALQPNPGRVDHLDLSALEPTANAPRLRIQLASQAVLVDDTPQRVPAQPFRLLVLLAQAVRIGRGPVRTHPIEDATGREARDLVRELRNALSAGRPHANEIRSWIKARRSLAAFELVLEPEQIDLAN